MRTSLHRTLVILAAAAAIIAGCAAPSTPSGASGPPPVAGAFPVQSAPAVADAPRPATQPPAPPGGPPGREVPIQGADHVAKGAPHEPYTTTPPTSGPHWSILGEGPVPWGVYRVQVPDEAQVHNLEHGGVIISYSCADCPDLVQQLEDLYARYTAANRLPLYPGSTKLVVAPYSGLPHRIALTAWGRIDELDAYDEARILRFVEAYRDNGPEAVP